MPTDMPRVTRILVPGLQGPPGVPDRATGATKELTYGDRAKLTGYVLHDWMGADLQVLPATAMQQAINQIITNGGGKLKIPAGDWDFDGAAVYVNNGGNGNGLAFAGVTIEGDGRSYYLQAGGVDIGTRLRDLLLVVGAPSGDATLGISSGFHISDLEILGGMSWRSVQIASSIQNVRIVPRPPAGRAGAYFLFCNVMTWVAFRVDNGTSETGGKHLPGILLDSCATIAMLGGGVNYCYQGIVTEKQFPTASPPGSFRSAGIHMIGVSFEGIKHQSLLLRGVGSANIQAEFWPGGNRASRRAVIQVGDTEIAPSGQDYKSYNVSVTASHIDAFSVRVSPSSGLDIPQGFGTSAVDIGTNVLTMPRRHYLLENQLIAFESDGTLPGGLAANTTYFAVNVTDLTLQVALTKNGSAIDLTSTGTLVAGEHRLLSAEIFGKIFGTADVNTTSDAITIAAHGFTNDSRVQLWSPGTLPDPLLTTKVYYIVNATADTFQLSLTKGGDAIDLTTVGTIANEGDDASKYHMIASTGTAIDIINADTTTVDACKIEGFDIAVHEQAGAKNTNAGVIGSGTLGNVATYKSETGSTRASLKQAWSQFVAGGRIYPKTTAGPTARQLETATNKNNFQVDDFVDGTQQFANFMTQVPTNWTGDKFTARAVWTASTASGGEGVAWEFGAKVLHDNVALSSGISTAVTVIDTVQSVEVTHISDSSPEFTIAGTLPAAGDVALCQVRRTPTNASDTLAADARLLGVILETFVYK
jgi:hypothetical protein